MGHLVFWGRMTGINVVEVIVKIGIVKIGIVKIGIVKIGIVKLS